MNIAETATWLKARDNFLVITHRRPDGDTLGCAAGLVNGLREIGKTAYILFNPETTEKYLQFVEKFWAPEDFVPSEVIVVDIASLGLFPKNGDAYFDSVTLCIDHHPSNSNFCDKNLFDFSRASCGEIVYDLLLELSGNVSAESATYLYVALSTDTGCFSFANTTANTLFVASKLIDAGAPHARINRMLFREKAKGRIVLEGMIFSGLQFYCSDTVGIATVTNEMMRKAGVTDNDMDEVASIPGSVANVMVGITIRELSSPNDCKVSVRSSMAFSSNDFCAHFGGGGHPMAAGFSLEKTVSEIRDLIVAAIPEFLPKP